MPDASVPALVVTTPRSPRLGIDRVMTGIVRVTKLKPAWFSELDGMA